jgi:hypothetical protein
VRRLLLSAALVVGVVAPAISAAPAVAAGDGSVGIRLVDAPSDRADDPRAKVYVVDHVPTGTTIRRRVEVSNTTAAPVHFSMYAAGAAIDGGTFSFASGRESNDLSGWTSIEPAELDVAPGAAKLATVTIAVPHAAPAGERYGVVWAEAAPLPSQNGIAEGRPNGIAEVSRVGVRMYLSVGGAVEPGSDFVVSSLTARRDKAGRPVVDASVRNTGARALDLSGELHLSEGPGGTSAGPFDVTLGTTLAPGDTAPVTIPLDPELPAGPWAAKLVLRSGTLERAATARISFPLEAGSASRPVPARMTPVQVRRTVLMPIAHSLLLLVVFGLLFLLWKRRRDDEEDEEPRSGGPQPALARR